MKLAPAARIEAVDLARADVDSARVDAAFRTHLDRLGLEPRRVWWEDDVASARRRYSAACGARDWWLACSRCRAAAEAAGWRPRADPERGQGQRAADPVRRIAGIWAAVEEATRGGAPRRQPLLPPNPVAPWLVEAVAWSSAPAPFTRAASVARWTQACTPLVDAYEAGLGFFWVRDDWIVAIPRPALSLVDGVLHDAAGPAVSWPDSDRYWFWRGVRVPRRAVEEPDSLTVLDVHREWNVEVRRVLVDRMGYDRYVREAGGKVIGADAYGRLWRCEPLWDEDEPLVLLGVENATREPDGSARRYFLRVPPTLATPHDAVAWSFDLAAPDYVPTAES